MRVDSWTVFYRWRISSNENIILKIDPRYRTTISIITENPELASIDPFFLTVFYGW